MSNEDGPIAGMLFALAFLIGLTITAGFFGFLAGIAARVFVAVT